MNQNSEKNIDKIIIGHSGYIGRELFESISNDDLNILGISRNQFYLKEEIENRNIVEINTDIFKDIISYKINLQSRPTIYISAHNIKTNFVCKRKSLEFILNLNFIFYTNFIENIKLLQPKKLIFISSGGSLYDNSKFSLPSNEDSTLNPISEYGLSKFILEKFLTDFSNNYEIPLVICRVGTVYGDSPSNNKFGFINYLIYCAKNNITPIIYGQESYRDYLHIKDLIKILIKIENSKLSSNLYNISYGKSYSCLQIYKKVKKYLNESGLEINEFDDQGPRLGENSNIFISSDKLKNELNWEPLININEGIKDLIDI